MNATAETVAPGHGGWVSGLWRRQLHGYPDTGLRVVFLVITVLATVTLYYELYVGGGVATLLLANLHMSFRFYVVILAFGNLIGAFGSLVAGLADRVGRANMVVFGLLFTGVFTAFVLPAATGKWTFGIETFVVALVEGICLVATPALIRDFSPQVGRATAMGFWISGPMLGSLIVAVVGSHTIPAVVADPRFWTHEYRICGITGLVMFVITLIGLRELSPQLRDQLMVTMRDRALVEARAKDIDVEATLRHPFRQLLKPDIVVSAFAVSVLLLLYFTAVGFLVIYLTTVFGFSVKNANGLGNWQWGFNAIGVILFGVISDRFRVRKPFMLAGGILAAVSLIVYLHEAGHHLGYYTVALLLVAISLSFALAVTPWLASFTETVEARNPALIATGLAIWGWIQRVVAFAAFLLIPVVITSVTPLVDYGPTASAYASTYASEISFATTHPAVVATATRYKTQLAQAQRFGPELAVIQDHPALFDKLATYSNPAKIPPALLTQGIAAAGGGARGVQILETIAATSKNMKPW
jgi:MFS family permease